MERKREEVNMHDPLEEAAGCIIGILFAAGVLIVVLLLKDLIG